MAATDMGLAPQPQAAMTEDDILAGFCDLFEGNPNYFGAEDGGCLPFIFDYESEIEDHLYGNSKPIGIYPIWRNRVKWGCIDFDEGEADSYAHALNVARLLQEFDIRGHVERSRSKGYHVWVFADSWGSAETMRAALIVACELVDAPTREINPKQTHLDKGMVGNYVRLPYPGAVAEGAVEDSRRTVVSQTGDPYSVEMFIARALYKRTQWDQLEELALLNKPARAEPVVHAVPSDIETYEGDAVSRMKPLTRWVYMMGPNGRERFRSDALWKLARMLTEDGRHTFDEALKLLTEADAKWGKFMPRRDGELRLEQLMRKAWGDST